MQGCPFRCYNCFNPETWDFNSGKKWTEDTEKQFIKLADRPYIKRVSILGGEPLADQNVQDVLNLVNKIRLLLPDKTIWLYTGYIWEYIFPEVITDDFNVNRFLRQEIVKKCDIIVDGRYIDTQRDITLRWRGSSNQRVIDIQQSLKEGEIVLWKT